MSDELTTMGVPLRTIAAIANPDRLALLGLLDRREMTVEDLVAELQTDPLVIGRHLAELGKAALVSTRKDGQRRLLSLRRETLIELAEWCAEQLRETESREPPLDVPESVRQFFSGARLSSFPARHSKKIEVLGVLVRDFETGMDYTESEVNQILLNRYPDFATLRRALIDEGLMIRAGGIYRRPM
jgi:DNA-binding transcriptional ArsR family regulator